jgi:hypothetical protein
MRPAHFDMGKARDERPECVVFNGRMGALLDARALTARTGEVFHRVWAEAGCVQIAHAGDRQACERPLTVKGAGRASARPAYSSLSARARSASRSASTRRPPASLTRRSFRQRLTMRIVVSTVVPVISARVWRVRW